MQLAVAGEMHNSAKFMQLAVAGEMHNRVVHLQKRV
jgi:hypothetical protein